MKIRIFLAASLIFAGVAGVGWVVSQRSSSKLREKLATANNNTEILNIEVAKANVQQNPMPVFVDLQEGFHSELVRIKLDGQVLYEGHPTTNEVLGLCTGININGNSLYTKPVIRIIIPSAGDGIDVTYSIDLNKGAYIGVSLGQDKSVKIIQSMKAFGYD